MAVLSFLLVVLCIIQTVEFGYCVQNSSVPCFENERNALVEFKHSLSDPSNRLSSWVGEHCCSWYGVGCDARTGNVVKVDLHNPYSWDEDDSYYDVLLVGKELNPSLIELKQLRYLDLSWNSFGGGGMPGFIGSFRHLRYLNLSFTDFSGKIPHDLGNLSSLHSLDLSRLDMWVDSLHWMPRLHSLQYLSMNRVNLTLAFDWQYTINQLPSLLELHLSTCGLGKLSPSFSYFNLTHLTVLDLSINYFGGEIPNFLLNITSLEILDLSYNDLNGTIPKDIGQLSELTTLDLSDNSLGGYVSEDHFAKLSMLQVLGMGNNSLVLNVGSRWIPPFQLKRLYLSSCKLGPNFPTWLQTQSQLTFLDISNSTISTSIPHWFANQTSTNLEDLRLSHNQIHGQVPTFMSPKLRVLYLSFNKFEGHFPHFPSNVESLKLHNNSISGPLPNDLGDMMPLLKAFKLSFNRINGTIPSSICRMKDLLYLDISNNQLSGDLPLCWASLHNLEVIDLTSNNLSGAIPSDHMLLKSLRLSRNNFHGEIPLSLRNSLSLHLLDVGENKLSGNIPSWIGDLLSLQFLRLRSNMFNGNIPSQLCHLKGLQIMDLSHNNLSGSIPHCFGNINAMVFGQATYISTSYADYEDLLVETVKGREYEYKEILSMLVILDVSSNELSGCIPKELTMLSGLIGLNLSNNNLTGSIPDKINKFSLLEYFDLSNNILSGRIPQSLSTIPRLSHLNLSSNILSGPIPSGNQLQTLNDPSIYEGNAGLCGDPLEKKCKREDDDDNFMAKDDRDDPGLPGLYIGMVFGFIVGFWGLGCVYWFNKPWRYAYLRFIDNVVDMVIFAVVVRVNRLKRKLERKQEVET